jgi:hypothetical protein
MFKVKVLILFLLAGSPVLLAQGLFTMPAVACVDQFIDVQSAVDDYKIEWDFCSRDLVQLPLQSNVGVLQGFLGGFGYKIVYDKGSYFAIVTSQRSDLS